MVGPTMTDKKASAASWSNEARKRRPKRRASDGQGGRIQKLLGDSEWMSTSLT